MNPLSGPRQQQQKQQQKQKTLRIKKQGNTLEFHSRLIEAAGGYRLVRYRKLVVDAAQRTVLESLREA
jgi:hypothetical protein